MLPGLDEEFLTGVETEGLLLAELCTALRSRVLKFLGTTSLLEHKGLPVSLIGSFLPLFSLILHGLSELEDRRMRPFLPNFVLGRLLLSPDRLGWGEK